MTRYPFRRYSLKPHTEQRNSVCHNSLFDCIQYKFRDRALSRTIHASWPVEDYNCPQKRKIIAQKLRLLRKIVRD